MTLSFPSRRDEILRQLGSPREVIYSNDVENCGWFAELRGLSEEIGFPPSVFEEFHNG